MKRRSVVMAGMLAAGLGAVMSGACETTGEPPPKAWWLAVQSASYCVQSPTITVTVPDGLVGNLEFKDKDGHPIAPPSHVEGGVTIEVPVPVGGVAYDWTLDKGGGSGSAPPSAWGGLLTPSPFIAGLVPDAPLAHRDVPTEHFMGCMTAKFDPQTKSYAYALRALSDDANEAYALMKAVLAGKVGTAVDPAVTVDAFIELSVLNGRIQLVSSMPAEFEKYEIHLGGAIVADLATGLNATVSHLPHGWVSITSVLPVSVVQPDTAMHLDQRAVGEPDGATLVIM